MANKSESAQVDLNMFNDSKLKELYNKFSSNKKQPKKISETIEELPSEAQLTSGTPSKQEETAPPIKPTKLSQ